MALTRIKICGLRRPEDIDMINRCLPDYAGFICCSRFWRYVPKDTLRVLSEKTDRRIRKVGVFVDDPVEVVSSYIKQGLVDMVQLHGHEDEEYIRKLRDSLSDWRQQNEAGTDRPPAQKRHPEIIKAFKIHSGEDIMKARSSSADLILLDGGSGNGVMFDWSLIHDIGRDYFMAGGLTPDNMKQAVERFHPYAVDISSGVETDRIKDESKIRQAVEAVRNL